MYLITDRTEADVLLGNEKGRYTYQDLNRVEQAVTLLCALAARQNINPKLTTKINWGLPGAFSPDSWPTKSQMTRYLQNVRTLCAQLDIQATLPKSMARLTYVGANQIEKALQAAYEQMQGVLQTYQFSGELIAGEENGL